MTTYQVDVFRGPQYWLVDVPDVDRKTQARHLREVDAMARDLIVLMADVEPGSIELDVRIHPPENVRAHLDRMNDLREREASAKREAAEELRAAARELRDGGLPLRDVGEVLGVSYQRAHQLVS